MARRSSRDAWLILGLVVVVAVVVPIIDGVVGDRGDNPREVFGRLPEEWLILRDDALYTLLFIALLGSWVAAHFVFNRATRRETGTPFCDACNYSLFALPVESVCPECGGAKRTFFRRAPTKHRFAAVAIVQALGVVGLLACLFSIAGEHPGILLFHAAMTLPVVLVAMDRRLTVSEAAFVAGLTLFTISFCIVLSVWEFTHSTDGQAAIGLVGASCSGWMFGGPGYLAAAIAVFLYRRQQAKRA
jgi:rubredoxin